MTTPDPGSGAAPIHQEPNQTLTHNPKFVDLAQYLTLPRSPETWLVEPLLPRGGSLLLYGDPKVGKSFAALQLASALLTSDEWLGFQCRSRGDDTPSEPCPSPQKTQAGNRVLYIQLDTPRSLWADRLERLPTLPLSHLQLADRETLQTWPFDILRDDHYILLKEELSKLNPDCVIIDTLRECHSGDENDSTGMQAVISRLEACVKPAALILVAHGRKVNPDLGPSLINDNRGSNYIVGKMDAIVHMGKTTLTTIGRALEEQTIHISRLDNGTWELAERDKVKRLARELLALDDGSSLRAKARKLASMTDREESTCLSILQRLSK